MGHEVVAHGRYAIFQMAEVAVPRELSRGILDASARRGDGQSRCHSIGRAGSGL